MSISSTDIQRVVDKEDDFGHEMRVGAAIRAIPSFEIQHGGTYTDSVTGKPRQFDYRCSLTKGGSSTLVLTIPAQGATGNETWAPTNAGTSLLLTVECKNLNPDFPLVICGTNRQKGEAFQDLIVSIGRSASVQRGSGSVVGPGSMIYRASGERSFYRSGEFVGKSVVRLKPENTRSPVAVAAPDSDIYEKWAQALSSGVELVKEAVACARDGQSIYSAALPAVVVSDDSLWRVAYDHKGKSSSPEQVQQCEFFVGRNIASVPGIAGTFAFSHIHFFTLSAFGSFLSKMAVNDVAWTALFDPGLLRFGPEDL